MSEPMYDTLIYSEDLEAGGVPEAQAKAHARALFQLLSKHTDAFATREDLHPLATGEELRAQGAKLATDIKALGDETEKRLLHMEMRLMGFVIVVVGAGIAVVNWLA